MPVTWTDPAAKDFASGAKLYAAELDTYVLANALYLYKLWGQQATSYPSSPETGQIVIRTDIPGIYRWNGSSWVSLSGGVGTVTSVGLLMPSIFQVFFSPVTTSDDIEVELATQAANRVFAGPTTGVDDEPTFRVLVDADIPNHAYTKHTYSGLTTGQPLRATSATAAAFGALDLANASAVTGMLPAANLPTIAETKGGTNQTTYTLGDLIYSSASNTLAKLAGNTTTTRKFLRQTGNGSVSAAPAWDTLTRADLPPHVGARVYNNANISVANNTTVYLTFNTERFDTDTIHSTSSNTSRFTLPYAGKWLILAHVSMALNATGQRAIQIWLNGTTVIASQVVPANANINTDVSIATVYDFAANDYVEMAIYQNSGGALNAAAQPNYSPEFSCHYMGT